MQHSIFPQTGLLSSIRQIVVWSEGGSSFVCLSSLVVHSSPAVEIAKPTAAAAFRLLPDRLFGLFVDELDDLIVITVFRLRSICK